MEFKSQLNSILSCHNSKGQYPTKSRETGVPHRKSWPEKQGQNRQQTPTHSNTGSIKRQKDSNEKS